MKMFFIFNSGIIEILITKMFIKEFNPTIGKLKYSENIQSSFVHQIAPDKIWINILITKQNINNEINTNKLNFFLFISNLIKHIGIKI